MGDPNLYSYVGNEPTNFLDPLGLERNSNDCGFLGWLCFDDFLGEVGQCLKYVISCVVDDFFHRLILPGAAGIALIGVSATIIFGGCANPGYCGLGITAGSAMLILTGIGVFGYYRDLCGQTRYVV